MRITGYCRFFLPVLLSGWDIIILPHCVVDDYRIAYFFNWIIIRLQGMLLE